MSVTGTAFGATQVPSGPPGGSTDYDIANSSATVMVWVNMGSTNAVTAVLPVSGGASSPGFGVPPNNTKRVKGPANAFFNAIGFAAGPSLITITPGEGMT